MSTKVDRKERTFLLEIKQYSDYRRFRFDPVFIEYRALIVEFITC